MTQHTLVYNPMFLSGSLRANNGEMGLKCKIKASQKIKIQSLSFPLESSSLPLLFLFVLFSSFFECFLEDSVEVLFC